MSTANDPADDKLPVTAEVGDEGGSYADATVQAETFAGGPGNPRVDPKTVVPPVGEHAPAASEGDPALDAGEIVKYPTERPDKR